MYFNKTFWISMTAEEKIFFSKKFWMFYQIFVANILDWICKFVLLSPGLQIKKYVCYDRLQLPQVLLHDNVV